MVVSFVESLNHRACNVPVPAGFHASRQMASIVA